MNILFDQNDVFLVTGAGSGLGKATALLLNQLGGSVIAIARNKKHLESLSEECIAPERIFTYSRDLSQEVDQQCDWFISLAQQHGAFKGAFCCAGILRIMPLRSESAEVSTSLYNLHFNSPMMLLKALASSRKTRTPKGGSVVLMSSISGVRARTASGVYSAIKAGIIRAAEAWAPELGKYNYRLNSISPGDIRTNIMTEHEALISNDAYYEKASKDFCLPGEGSPKDIAHLVTFLLSDYSRWITGQNIQIDGGQDLIK